MINSVVFHNLAKDLFGRLGIDFDKRGRGDVLECPDVKKILIEPTGGRVALTEQLKEKFSWDELRKLSKPKEFDAEIKRLAALDTNPVGSFDPNSPINADVEVLEQIFAFTATLYDWLEGMKELIPDPGTADISDHEYKKAGNLADQLTVAVNNLKDFILKPILDSFEKLFDIGYRGELKSVRNQVKTIHSNEFEDFLRLKDVKYID